MCRPFATPFALNVINLWSVNDEHEEISHFLYSSQQAFHNRCGKTDFRFHNGVFADAELGAGLTMRRSSKIKGAVTWEAEVDKSAEQGRGGMISNPQLCSHTTYILKCCVSNSSPPFIFLTLLGFADHMHAQTGATLTQWEIGLLYVGM